MFWYVLVMWYIFVHMLLYFYLFIPKKHYFTLVRKPNTYNKVQVESTLGLLYTARRNNSKTNKKNTQQNSCGPYPPKNWNILIYTHSNVFTQSLLIQMNSFFSYTYNIGSHQQKQPPRRLVVPLRPCRRFDHHGRTTPFQQELRACPFCFI